MQRAASSSTTLASVPEVHTPPDEPGGGPGAGSVGASGGTHINSEQQELATVASTGSQFICDQQGEEEEEETISLGLGEGEVRAQWRRHESSSKSASSGASASTDSVILLVDGEILSLDGESVTDKQSDSDVALLVTPSSSEQLGSDGESILSDNTDLNASLTSHMVTA